MASSIKIRDISKYYGSYAALADVSIDILPGQFVILLGPSGSGKTTLLMSLAGFIDPDRGSIQIDSQEILTLEPNKREIGVVFQSYALFPHMSVAGNVEYPLKLRNVPGAERRQRVERALETVQMGGLGERRIHELSGGQKQRVALARAIVFEPKIILMDEPLSALDKKLREQMQIELKHLHQRLQSTIVYVTHDQKEALTLADKVVVMNRGRIIQEDTPREIYHNPNSRFVADFIGDSNFLPLYGERAALVETHVTQAYRERAIASRKHPLLVLRPEKLEIVSSEERRQGFFYIDAIVDNVLFQGDVLIVFSKLPNGDIIRLQRGTGRAVLAGIPERGGKLRLAIHEDDAVVVEDDVA